MQLTSVLSATNLKKLIVRVAFIFGAVILLMIFQDYLESTHNGSAFYWFESFIFSSFWWLFAPLLYKQYYFFKVKQVPLIAKIALPMAIHFFAYPALVWLISGLFYYHTFSYTQTLNFEISAHLYKIIIVFSAAPIIYYYLTGNKFKLIDNEAKIQFVESTNEEFPTTWWVLQGKKRLMIQVSSITHLTANPPYLNVYCGNHRYLVTETLRSALDKLGPEFIRVHKSAIINKNQAIELRSRLNGDYDIILQKGEIQRLSRNYAGSFKKSFQQGPQDSLITTQDSLPD